MNRFRRSLILSASFAGLLPVSLLAADQTLASLRARGKLRVGTEAAFEPFEYLEGGKIVGYGRDLLTAVERELGMQVEQENLAFAGLLPGLAAKKFDLVATSVGLNEERAKRFAFTRPIASVQDVVLVRTDNSRVKSIDDLGASIVATQLGSASQKSFEQMRTDVAKKTGKTMPDPKLFTTYPDCGIALANKQVEAIIAPTNIVAQYKKNHPDGFKVIATLGEPFLICWVTSADNKELRDFLNNVFNKMESSGELGKLQDKWLGVRLQLPRDGYMPPGAL